jgi:hypothetical protein
MKKRHEGTMCCSGEFRSRRWYRARRWDGPGRSRGKDARAHEEEQVDQKYGDEDEAADEDVRPESHNGFMFWEIGRRNVVVLVVAFVVVFVHADKVTS